MNSQPTLGQSLDPNLPCNSITLTMDYHTHVIRQFKCGTCNKVLFELVTPIENDGDFVFPLKVVCKGTAHLLTEREHTKENANIIGEGKGCARSTALAHLRKFL